MTENHLVSLIIRHWSGELADEETAELMQWAKASRENQQILDGISNEETLKAELDTWRNLNAAGAWPKLEHFLKTRKRARIRRIVGWSAVAAILIALAMIGLNRNDKVNSQQQSLIAKTVQVIMPGRNTAQLTLSNGQVILLDSAADGSLAVQGNTRLLKIDSGTISYIVSGNSNKEAVVYNTLTTPRSGQYRLTLPDGSRVWLNNVSSLRYPTSFKGKERTVELTGEAYFEIARDAARPFHVKVRDQVVNVLGTSFNIMAYSEEESIQTTLLSGSVKIEVGRTAVELRPDEQAQWKKGGKLSVVKDVPSQDIISWKEGFFYFGRASFAAVMRQLARWYDVEVVYKGEAPTVEFGGKIDRSLPLNDLLKFLDKNQIHFRLNGRQLIVQPS